MDQTQPTSAPTGAASPGATTHIVLRTADVRVVEYVLQPGASLAWHHHTTVTDRFYCLEGAIAVDLRDPAKTHRLDTGETLSVPPGTVHRSANAAAGVSRYLLVQGVGRYDFLQA